MCGAKRTTRRWKRSPRSSGTITTTAPITPAALSREQWDYFQRLLLVLESDGRLEETTRRRWRGVAGGRRGGAGRHGDRRAGGCSRRSASARGCWSPACRASRRRSRRNVLNRNADRRLYESRRLDSIPYGNVAPFDSVDNLAAARHAAPRFRKRRYPPEVGDRRVRDATSELLSWVQTSCAWFLAAPLVLLAQLPAARRDAPPRYTALTRLSNGPRHVPPPRRAKLLPPHPPGVPAPTRRGVRGRRARRGARPRRVRVR